MVGRKAVWVNTGGHGSEEGLGPDTDGLGETKFFMEDYASIASMPGIKGVPHNVTMYTPPVYPDQKIDVIDAWCYSIKHTGYM